MVNPDPWSANPFEAKRLNADNGAIRRTLTTYAAPAPEELLPLLQQITRRYIKPGPPMSDVTAAHHAKGAGKDLRPIIEREQRPDSAGRRGAA